MNTGIQRSSTTPQFAWTNTTPVDGSSHGKKAPAKPAAMLIAEHGCAYAATANPAYMKDFKEKLKKAVDATKHGFAYIHEIVKWICSFLPAATKNSSRFCDDGFAARIP